MISSFLNTLTPVYNVGWSARHGGRGGSKSWLGAQEIGAEVHFQVKPQRVRVSLVLEYYKHFELPMGVLDIELWEGVIAAARSTLASQRSQAIHERSQVDACCTQPCVGPPNMGFYHRSVIARGLKPGRLYTAVLRLVNRTNTTCQQLGSQFSIVSLIATEE